jgi:DNA helicase-2/ATP-dependent DNA helicase PcrA
MTIAPELMSDKIDSRLFVYFQKLNEDQRKIVLHDDGPLLVIAGPGSGKTECLTLRAMNLLLLKKAKLTELVVCTYTEKAAFEIQDRLSDIARTIEYRQDFSQMRVGTIHSICNRFIAENLHRMSNADDRRPPIGNNYGTLDHLPQRLFIFEHLKEICGKHIQFFVGRWGTSWNASKQFQSHFDKITEELIDVNELLAQRETFSRCLADTYRTYQGLLARYNLVDFAHLQKIMYGFLRNPGIAHYIQKDICYILVDEYQDTNFIQEQILIMLAAKTKNICVVGDEDQSLYRFRGATVQNIRRFEQIYKIHKDEVVFLATNYRSHPDIIDVYNNWINSTNWFDFRSNKWIQQEPGKVFETYPAVFSLLGLEAEDEASQIAELVAFLTERSKISDYNQVVLLLNSVKEYKSNVYVKALEQKGIPVYCSRAGTYFNLEEVKLITGCFAYIFNYSVASSLDESADNEVPAYIKHTLSKLATVRKTCFPLATCLSELETEFAQLAEGQTLHKQLADYFYQILSFEPFVTFTSEREHENKMHNLVIYSQLLQTFQNFYHYDTIRYENRERLVKDFFGRFLHLLFDEGVNQYENPKDPFPQGYVPVMTIHQAKGLEFPVVVVGSLERDLPELERIDKKLRPFYHRSKYALEQSVHSEPDQSIPLFDYMRQYYVAFSRAMNILVLTGNRHNGIAQYFDELVEALPQWPNVKEALSEIQPFRPKRRPKAKPRYSYTGHIRMYETCPRQYQFYREYQFVPSRPADTFVGLLVHQTIEKIHRIARDKQISTLTAARLRELFEQTYYFLALTNMSLPDERDKEKAFKQVEDYFYNNQVEMYDVKNVEEQVAIMKGEYILTGKIDVVMERNGKREIWDLKTSGQQEPDSLSLEQYERQLYMYAHALEQRDDITPERLVLYWTERSCKEDALMVFPYQRDKVDIAVDQFEKVVAHIKAGEFTVANPPHPHICKKCDLRSRCIREGVIEPLQPT